MTTTTRAMCPSCRSTYDSDDSSLEDDSTDLSAEGSSNKKKRIGGRQICGRASELLVPGLRTMTLQIWYIWLAGGSVNYGVILIQPDIIGAEHSGERCPSYGMMAVGAAAGEQPGESVWLDGLGDGTPRDDTEQLLRSQYCAQQLNADDYAATFLVTSGEIPGLIIMCFIIDRIGRRATIGFGAEVCVVVLFLLIPCTSQNLETVLIWVGRGVSSALFQFTSTRLRSTRRRCGPQRWESGQRWRGWGWC
jgi:hypothetical protein